MMVGTGPEATVPPVHSPEAGGTCKTKSAFNRVVGGILKKESQKAGARAKIRIGIAEAGAVEAALARIGGIVSCVAKPGHSKLGYQRRLLEQGNFLRGDVAIQVRHQHFSE